MCGIILSTNVNDMWHPGTLVHRGPDESFQFFDGTLGVEFQRLSIVGGAEGSMPIVSEDGRWQIFLNGEVYNFRALQMSHRLGGLGSDSRTVVEGVARQGLKFLGALRGMFAGVLYDRLERKLFLFRDALGEKPLYWAKHANTTLVASELRAIIRHLGDLSISDESLRDFHHFGYVEEPRTLDQRVFAVPRGSVHELDMKSGQSKRILELQGYGETETSASFRELLQIIVEEQGYLEQDATVLLSGGFDSTSLASQLNARNTNRISPVIARFSKASSWKAPRGSVRLYSESRTAIRTSKTLGLPFETVTIDRADFIHHLESIASALDQPHADPSSIGYLALFRRTRESGKKIAFVGHGWDEFFWGYPRESEYLASLSAGGVRKSSIEHHLPKSLIDSHPQRFDVDYSERFGSSDPFLESKDPWTRTRAHLVHSYLNHNGFSQVDRLAMSVGVEPRAPWSDSRLYGWAQNNEGANTVESLMKGVLKTQVDLGPLESIKSRRKHGFLSPAYRWILQREVDPLLESLKEHTTINQYLEIYVRGKVNADSRYKTAILGLWLESLNQQLNQDARLTP